MGAHLYALVALLLPRYVQGFLCRSGSSSFFVQGHALHPFLIYLYYNSFFLSNYLVDIFAVDFPSNKQHRFLLYYSF